MMTSQLKDSTGQIIAQRGEEALLALSLRLSLNWIAMCLNRMQEEMEKALTVSTQSG